MIEFDLFEEVIIDFSKDETFTRYTTATNNIGREEKTPLPTFDIFCYIHHASDTELKEVERQGYHPEGMIKIFTDITDDLLKDDEVSYSGDNYRVMKNNPKLVGDYKKYFAELLKS